MSFLLTLDENKLTEVIPFIEKFEAHINAAEPIFNLDGRRLEEILRTLPHHQSSYDKSLQEAKALEEWLISIKDARVAKLWKKYNEGYSRALTTRDIQSYIGGEPIIIELNQILIEVVLLKNNLNSIVESIKQLGWMCSNIVKLRVAMLEEAVL